MDCDVSKSADTYSFRPSLLGAPWRFELTGGGLDWSTGRKSGRMSYGAVRRVRLSYRPVNMQSQRFVTEIWAENGPKLQIVSSSWKSMFVQERLDAPYAAFVGELHRRITAAATHVIWEQGVGPLKYWPGLVIFLAAALAMAALSVRALQAQAYAAAALVAFFLVSFLWQGGNFFRRNRPGHYRPPALPAEVMPKDSGVMMCPVLNSRSSDGC